MEHWRMRCFNCMAQLDHEAEVCPRCGWDNRNRINGEGMLEQTVLNDQYLIGRALGRGGFGVTYTGFDLNLQLRVAIKEYFPITMAYRDTGTQSVKVYRNSAEEYENGLRRALDESRTVAGLGHVSNVVRVYNVFRANGTVYIVMEYIDGTTLAKLVGQRGRMGWKQALTLLYPIMRALEKVHGKGIIHRDVSPDNIMLDRETNEAVLLDFGAAREAREGLTTVLRPGYAPLEQYSERTHQDGRVDEYALCATMYFLITGEAPASADLRAYAKRELKMPRSLGCDIPPEVEAVLLKGMAVQADDRYESMAALRRAFEEAEGDKTRVQDKRTTVKEEKTIKKEKKNSSKFGMIVALVITLLVLFGLGVVGMAPYIKDLIPHLSDRSSVTEVPAKKETQGQIGTKDNPTSTSTPTPSPVPKSTPTANPVSKSTPTPAPETAWRPMLRDGGMTWEQAHDSDYDPPVLGNEVLKRSEIEIIEFVDSLEGAGDGAWDVSDARDGSALAWVDGRKLVIAGRGGVTAPVDASYLFAKYENLTSIAFNGSFFTGETENMCGMFFNCTSLTCLDVSSFDTGMVTDMDDMFSDCSSLTSLDVSGLDTGNVTDMQFMFDGCKSLTSLDVSGFNTGTVTNMLGMFFNCTSLTCLDVSGFETGKVTDMGGMFMYCTSLASLDVGGFDTGKVTSMGSMFDNCTSLTSLDVSGFDTGDVTYMVSMFQGCTSLTSLDVSGFDTGKVTDMDDVFRDCSSLTKLYMSDSFVYLDIAGSGKTMTEATERMFRNCPAKVLRNGETLSSEEWLAQAIIKPPIQKGDKGDSVKWLQRVLIKLGYLDDEIDGAFGDKTEAALVRFQQDNALTDSGAADAETVRALCHWLTKGTAYVPTPTPEPVFQTGEISDSWEQIIAAIDDGSARQRYAVGETKVLELGKLGTIHMQLAGFDLDERADGNGKATTTWIAVELLPDGHAMNVKYGNIGGWRDSDLRAYLQNAVLSAMPSNIRDRLICVYKGQCLGDGDIQFTEDTIWIPDSSEIFGKDALYFDLFRDSDVNRVKTRNSSAVWWWLRSACYTSAFRIVYNDGSNSSYSGNIDGGVALGFCL